MLPEHQAKARIPRKRYVQLSLLVWVAMLGIDFLLHGGVFSAVYVEDSPFLLSPLDAFRRIPLGYLALLTTSALLVWIFGQTSVRAWKDGLTLGLTLGALMGLSSTLGLFSISTAGPMLLVASFVSQMLQAAVAGVIVAEGLRLQSLRRLAICVIIAFVLLFAGTIVLQSTGLALQASLITR